MQPSPLPLEIDCRELSNRLASSQPCILVDCREQEEFDLVHLAGARLLPMSEISARVNEIAELRELPLVVYCHHGMRSAQTTAWLRNQGFSHVQSLAGGIDAWAADIDPSLPRY